MISKADLLAEMLRECDICVHLAGKVPPGGLEFRFTPTQRSTLELLQYISFVGTAFAAAAVTGTWDRYGELEKAASSLAAADFPAAMERQKAALRDLLAGVPDADLAAKRFKTPWGDELPLGRALIELPLGSLIAYRMQLFLQAKAAGNAEIWTPNCWAGVDMARNVG